MPDHDDPLGLPIGAYDDDAYNYGVSRKKPKVIDTDQQKLSARSFVCSVLRDLRYSGSVDVALPDDDSLGDVEFLDALGLWLDTFSSRLKVASNKHTEIAAELQEWRDLGRLHRKLLGGESPPMGAQ